MDENEIQDALEILRSGTIRGQTFDVTDEQKRALKEALDELSEFHEAATRRPVAASPANMFFMRG